MECHSQTIGHRVIGNGVMRLHLTKCTITHRLLVIGKDEMRMPFTKVHNHSQTVGHKKMDETAFTNVQSLTSCWSLERCEETAFHNVQCHSQAVEHSKRCDEVITFTKCTMSLTDCWS